VYSVRPHPRACVSTPVTWKEIDKGVQIEDFRLDNVRARFRRTGDLFKPLLLKAGRVDLGKFLRHI
jgi:bifunctional non-homologous end joining protein LigD